MWCPGCVSGRCVYSILKNGLSIFADRGVDACSDIGPSPVGRTVDGSRSRRRMGHRDNTDPCVYSVLLPASDRQDCVVRRHNALAPVMQFVATSRPLPAPGRDGMVNKPVKDAFRAPYLKQEHSWVALCHNCRHRDLIFYLSIHSHFPVGRFWLGSRREPAPFCFFFPEKRYIKPLNRWHRWIVVNLVLAK